MKRISLKGSDLLGETIQNPGTESRLRASFSARGMMVIDGRTGEILAANSQVEWKSSPFVSGRAWCTALRGASNSCRVELHHHHSLEKGIRNRILVTTSWALLSLAR